VALGTVLYYIPSMTRFYSSCGALLLACGGMVDTSADPNVGGTTGMHQSGGLGGASLSSGGKTSVLPEQELRNSLTTWCPQICSKLISCNALSIEDNCVADCTDGFGSLFLGQGDTCAQLGLKFEACVSSLDCVELNRLQNQGDSVGCVPGADEISTACEGISPGQTSDPVPPGVTCQSSSGMVSGSPSVGSVVCDSGANGCSDRHDYRLTCVYQGNGSSTCTCLLDGKSQTQFAAPVSACPTVGVVNAGCGWNLARL
jgi:hypothetical protein